MISKEEAMNKLKKAGYNVVDDNSVLTILIPKEETVKNVVKKLTELFQKIDYKASFGVKQHADAINSADIPDNNEDIEDDLLEDADVTQKENNDSLDGKDKKTGNISVSKKDLKNDSSDNSSADSDDGFLDDEDDEQLIEQRLDNYDMDMLLGEEGIQFSLDDFGMLS